MAEAGSAGIHCACVFMIHFNVRVMVKEARIQNTHRTERERELFNLTMLIC